MAPNTRWYTNGEINIQIPLGGKVPEGFVRGMKKHPYSEERRAEIAKKRKETCLERYGVEVPVNDNEESHEKAVNSYLEHYGVDRPFKSKEIWNKANDTLFKRYGVRHPLQSEKFMEKSKQTNLKHRGVFYPTQSKDVMQKQMQTNRKIYGVNHYFQTEEFKKKSKITCLKKYGRLYYSRLEVAKERNRNTCLRKYGVSNPAKVKKFKVKRNTTFQNTYNVKLLSYGKNSSYNTNFENILNSLGVDYEREFHIGSYSYDFKVGNTLIEIDPTWTHNVLKTPYGDEVRITPNYHQQKSQVAFQNGYHCIHIFDWDNPNAVAKYLKSINEEILTDYSDNVLNIKVIDSLKYLKEFSLQGICNTQDVCLGFKDYEGNIISLMSFVRLDGNTWELLRYCFSHNVINKGYKILNYFINVYNPKSIICHRDISKFSEKFFTKLGFKLVVTDKPNKHWYSSKDSRHLTDTMLNTVGYNTLFGTNFEANISNVELIIQRGYLPVYDCGQSTYIWNKE